eukprot:CAMPEP_0197318608 /NCGR_PEP_ID=MMETSP0891-20130614/51770_1 /TAXON_ID=44058 ORGANISM="Aureoumbra lagunensis, Strain CCMP1510" /NCGR_SAMPLE_ID=MMETSP0891 /ASSEMBLY_ACC=CAM_ASM_000534 /LENGTH=1121 /DNA_ID=CAMNT_0042809155 /DNA_START=99 /DNA_END=3464 /DNA_ORIENTATION=-
MANEVRSMCLGSRCMNVYDVDSRTLVFKLTTDESNKKKKVLLLMEAGSRFLISSYDVRSSENQQPSSLCAKFRAAVKGKRINDCRVLDWDRIVIFRFGAGDSAAHVILEMFGTGNLILCNEQFIILRAVREDAILSSKENAENEQPKKGQAVLGREYDQRKKSIQALNNLQEDAAIASIQGMRAFATFLYAEKAQKERERAQIEAQREIAGLPPRGGRRKKKKGDGLTIKQILIDARSGIGAYGQDIVDHCLALCTILSPNDLFDQISDDALAQISNIILSEAPKILAYFQGAQKEQAAIIILSDDNTEEKYASFAPLALAQHKGRKKKEFTTFCACVDEYFKSVLEARLTNNCGREASQAEARVTKIRNDQQKRLQALAQDTETRKRRAQALEINAEQVDAVLSVIKSALNAGLKWDELEEYVDTQARNGSALAKLVKVLDLPNRKVTLSLPSVEYYTSDSSTENQDNKYSTQEEDEIFVTLSLDSTAMAAAREEWSTAKRAQAKAQKTQSAASEAVRIAEKIKTAQLAKLNSKAQQKTTLNQLDRPEQILQLWFLKYAWFISSEGYLCLCPHDKAQAELLLFTHFRPGKDVLVALEDGRDFPPCIVRGKMQNDKWLVSPLALAEAGSYVACRSSAWIRKERASAFWSSQIAPCGKKGFDFVSGALCDFAVRRKEFLPPAILELNLTVLFLTQDANGAFGEQRVDELITLSLPSDECNTVHDAQEVYRDITLPEACVDEDTALPPCMQSENQDNFSLSNNNNCDDMTSIENNEDSGLLFKKDEEEPSAAYPHSLKNEKSVESKPPSKSKQKKKKERSSRRVEDSSSDEDLAFDVASKRGRRRQMARAQHSEDGSTTSSKTRSGRKKDKESDLKQQRLEAERNEAAKAAIARMSPGVRTLWDKTVDLIPKTAVPAMAFELAILADELNEVNAIEALDRFRDAEKTAQQRAQWGSTNAPPRNHAALLSGICRRVASGKGKINKDTSSIEVIENASSKNDETDDTQLISRLTANPQPSDNLIGAVVLTAPVASSRNYKHTIKITPGPAKKGKAAKDALEILLNGDHPPEQVSHLQQIRLNDVVAALVSHVKLQATKLDALKQRRKQLDKTLRKHTMKQQQRVE